MVSGQPYEVNITAIPITHTHTRTQLSHLTQVTSVWSLESLSLMPTHTASPCSIAYPPPPLSPFKSLWCINDQERRELQDIILPPISLTQNLFLPITSHVCLSILPTGTRKPYLLFHMKWHSTSADTRAVFVPPWLVAPPSLPQWELGAESQSYRRREVG